MSNRTVNTRILAGLLALMVVSAIVLYAGLSALIASVQAILEPETAEYTPR